jgi:hypothetical protein
MKKVAAVSQVRVSLKDGLTVLDLKAGNAVTLAELRLIIKNNGFVPKEAAVIAHGQPDEKEPLTFVVSGSSERLWLSSPPHKSGEDWQCNVRVPDKR